MFELIEDPLHIRPAEFFFARDVRLYRGDTQELGRRMNLQGAYTISKNADDRRHRQGQVVMRSHRSHLCLENETVNTFAKTIKNEIPATPVTSAI